LRTDREPLRGVIASSANLRIDVVETPERHVGLAARLRIRASGVDSGSVVPVPRPSGSRTAPSPRGARSACVSPPGGGLTDEPPRFPGRGACVGRGRSDAITHMPTRARLIGYSSYEYPTCGAVRRLVAGQVTDGADPEYGSSSSRWSTSTWPVRKRVLDVGCVKARLHGGSQPGRRSSARPTRRRSRSPRSAGGPTPRAGRRGDAAVRRLRSTPRSRASCRHPTVRARDRRDRVFACSLRAAPLFLNHPRCRSGSGW
jgi:hypothetical protein